MLYRVQQPAFKCCLAAALALVVVASGFGAISLADEGGIGETAVAANLRYGPPPDASKACEYAWDAARRAASHLAHEAGLLIACAERGDFGNPCFGEFRRVRNAQSDYESAANTVQSHCA